MVRNTGSSGTATVITRSMRSDELNKVVSLHLDAFPGYFLSFLGPKVLRLFYRSYLDFDQVAIVAERKGRLVGFVTGIDNAFGFYKKLLLRRGILFALASAQSILKRPSIAPRLFRSAFKRSRKSADSVSSITLSYIAVDPAVQKCGIGQILASAFENEALRRGMSSILLETDAIGNDDVLSFYSKAGYKHCEEYYTHEGKLMYKLQKKI